MASKQFNKQLKALVDTKRVVNDLGWKHGGHSASFPNTYILASVLAGSIASVGGFYGLNSAWSWETWSFFAFKSCCKGYGAFRKLFWSFKRFSWQCRNVIDRIKAVYREEPWWPMIRCLRKLPRRRHGAMRHTYGDPRRRPVSAKAR